MAVSNKGERLPLPQAGDASVRDDDTGNAKALVPRLTDLISRCWQTDPQARPELPAIISELRSMLELCSGPRASFSHSRRQSFRGTSGSSASATGDVFSTQTAATTPVVVRTPSYLIMQSAWS